MSSKNSKVIRTFKKRVLEASGSSKVLRTFWVFLELLRKLKKKIEAICAGFLAELFGSQSIEIFCFARKT